MMHHDAAGRIETLFSSAGRGWDGLEAEFLRIPAGRTDVPGTPMHRIGLHVGAPVGADCRCDGRRYRRVQQQGDFDIVPAGLDGSWTDDGECHILRLRVSVDLLHRVAGDRAVVALVPRFQLRDPRLEAIGWALKAELEAAHPSDRLYAQSLGVALATRLLAVAGGAGDDQPRPVSGLSPRQRRLLVAYIAAHLDQSLSLDALAREVGLSVSHFKHVFKNTFGVPVHRYVMQCRVDRARVLLQAGTLALSEIALEAGFADQSHMTHAMRRMVGLSPRAVARLAP